MSVHVLSWVLRNSEEKLGRRLTLLVLADHAKEDGTEAWPSVPTIAREARLSTRQVQTCLQGLVESGAIAQTGVRPNGTRIYRVTMGGAVSAPLPVGGAVSSVEGVQFPTSGGADTAPEPSLEQPSIEPSIEQSGAEAPEIVDLTRPPPVWLDGRTNLPLDALTEACSIDPKSPRLTQAVIALNGRGKTVGIRDLFWIECQRVAEARSAQARLAALQANPEEFARLLADRIRLKADMLLTRDAWRTSLDPKTLREQWLDLEMRRGSSDDLTADEIRRFGEAA